MHNMKQAATNKTIFFMKDCVFVNLINVPKHPQSSVKLKNNVDAVNNVKNSSITIDMITVFLIHKLNNKHIPTLNSTIIKKNTNTGMNLTRCNKFNDIKYLSNTNPTPTGSMPFVNAENRNTQASNILNIAIIYFMVLFFTNISKYS